MPDNAATKAPGSGAGRWGILAVLCAAGFIIVIDTTIMNVSISAIVRDLDTTVTGVQLAITMYMLVMAAFMITGSKLGTILGRKRAFIIGTVLFAIGTGITGFAKNLFMLTVGWSVIEGIGAALMLPSLWSLGATNFKGKQRAVALAVIGGVIGAAAAGGPILGGLITNSMGWQWAFRLELVIAIPIIIFSFAMEDEPVSKKARLDYPGIVLSAAGMATVVFGILMSSKWGLVGARSAPFDIYGLSPVPFIILAGLVLLACFAAWQKRLVRVGGEPLVRISLLKIAPFSTGLVLTVFQYVVVTGAMFAIPLYMQKVMDLDALATGVGLLPMSVALLAVSILIPRVAKRFYPKYVLAAAMLIMAAGAFILAFLTPADPGRADMIVGLAVLGAGSGLLAGTLPNLVMSTVPQEAINEAAGLNNSTDQVGGALGTAIIGAILIASLSWGGAGMVMKSDVIPPERKEEITTAIEKDMEVVSSEELRQALSEEPAELREELVRIYEKSADNAFAIVGLFTGIIAMLGMGVALLLPKEKYGNG
jgi:EmrB/QacA subfamily drug resistance transporter